MESSAARARRPPPRPAAPVPGRLLPETIETRSPSSRPHRAGNVRPLRRTMMAERISAQAATIGQSAPGKSMRSSPEWKLNGGGHLYFGCQKNLATKSGTPIVRPRPAGRAPVRSQFRCATERSTRPASCPRDGAVISAWHDPRISFPGSGASQPDVRHLELRHGLTYRRSRSVRHRRVRRDGRSLAPANSFPRSIIVTTPARCRPTPASSAPRAAT